MTNALTNMKDSQWASLLVNYDDVECHTFPYIGQPKLNGFRAKWNGRELVSRQGEIWSPNSIPHIYDKLSKWSANYPGIILDGELYAHGLSFQEIERRAAINRESPHVDSASVDYWAFDIISNDDAESRQITLSQIYKPWVAVCNIANAKEADQWLHVFLENGFEGLVLRAHGNPYLSGRTEAILKLKPWVYGVATIKDCVEGQGKFAGMLGAFIVTHNSVRFRVGGGNVTEEEREAILANKEEWKDRRILIRYRDTFASGKPVQPQIYKLSV